MAINSVTGRKRSNARCCAIDYNNSSSILIVFAGYSKIIYKIFELIYKPKDVQKKNKNTWLKKLSGVVNKATAKKKKKLFNPFCTKSLAVTTK